LRQLLKDHVISAPPPPPRDPEPTTHSALAGSSGVSPLQAFAAEPTAVQAAFPQAGSTSHLATILIRQVLSVPLGLDRSAQVQLLQQQLLTREKQIDQKDQQIASLHRILDKAIGSAAGSPTGATTQGTPSSAGAGPDTIYEEKAADYAQRLDDLVELDFPRASEVAAELETWVESHAPRLSNASLAKLYHLILRVEIKKVRRGLPGADLAKAQRFFKKADDALR
jgi:hypothetical protein